MTEEIDWTGISAVLDRPFDANEVKHYSNGQQSFAYIDARQVAERLDEAVGKQHWHDEYLIPRGYEGTGAVQCILTLHGVSKMDVGYPNAPIDATNKAGKKMSDEPLKDAHSDALKRAAVHWGIGRHLYEDKPKQGRQQEPDEPYRSDVPKASPYKPASANQLATIAKLSRLLGQPEEPDEQMTSAEASDRLTELSREYNERKGSKRPFSDPAPSADGPAVQVMEDGRRVNTETGERLEDNPFDGQGVHDQNQDPSPTVVAAQRELANARSAYAAFHHIPKKDAMKAALSAITVPLAYSDWTVSHYTALTIWMNSNSQPEPAQEPEREVMEV